ncbi:hypothetical protein EHI8A_138000 [Entamoeba histolytica HM-1:IMSS-B]|uniref:Uncharacterized protein n=8 Tax=Entamoeba TaxID=5758 RepID=C4LX27_ENTH1|nr:hypothetical protein ENU1_023900 [Entamoeba nuttalli P19]XP_653268.1 hypothetical protein EHI_159450 [Entamoeba histolytica HM-1:IMSS]EMD47325.1 Hypothetical protein EHI5A_171300 [Entamoeba histolytica KU27]EMH73180.1 hypothetical protein EHI8A_138000 [Entamoeba histolytica HM-1:IMSS-B]EMS12581.1 hypothetical protein KM1_214990 [Entamoeba histolytica HM-3:IMSS]ENY65140.1 hypothetical protein EHI7A_127420 [Entamoeba histolytica HM-1:IMSS-A]GAT93280.1 hypothetical protein CL6EHI_159450 [Enta|eukprot:XP_008855312.1 hypothetical protein ENU1_023900 [Entamoeba nuttalli P19]
MNVEQQLASMYNQNIMPVELSDDTNNSTTQILLKLYDQCCPHSKDEEKDFMTTDIVVLRNTAINSLIGRGPITEEKIQLAMKNYLEKQHEFYINWKAQQAMNYLTMNSFGQ